MLNIRVILSLSLLSYLVNAQSEYRVPDSPENVRIKTTSTSATLWWNPPSSARDILVRGYTVSYGIETPSKKIVIEGVETNSFKIEGLKPNTTYVFAVTAYNEADVEDSEKVLLTAKTAGAKKEEFFKLPSPSEIAVTAISSKDVDVSWKDTIPKRREENMLGTKKRFYLIHYSPVGSQIPPKKLSTEKTRALLTNLEGSMEYQIMIRTILPNDEESPWSPKVLIRTPSDPESAPLTYQNAPETLLLEEACDFEPIHMCDFFSESTAPLQFRRQSSHFDPSLPKTREENAGHFMVVTSTRDPLEKYGRLYSPVWTFDDSTTFCLTFWDYIRKDSFGSLIVSLLYEGDSINMAITIYKTKVEKVGKEKWHKILVQSKLSKNRSFQVIFEVRKSAPRERFWVAIDDILAHGGHCPNDGNRYDSIKSDEETDVDLLTPLENLINTDPRVYRTKGLDGLPAVGIQRGVEIVVPYRIYLPRKFFPNFAIVASIKPKDNQGGYLFAIVNAFDTVVDLGVLLAPAGRSQTNISLVYTDSQISSSSNIIASFLVPAFTNQWTQFALEISGDNVALYFRCMRFATRQVRRQPAQLQMDDASKLYIANAGPIIGGGFEAFSFMGSTRWWRVFAFSLSLFFYLNIFVAKAERKNNEILVEDGLVLAHGRPSPNILPPETPPKNSDAIIEDRFLTNTRKKRQIVDYDEDGFTETTLNSNDSTPESYTADVNFENIEFSQVTDDPPEEPVWLTTSHESKSTEVPPIFDNSTTNGGNENNTLLENLEEYGKLIANETDLFTTAQSKSILSQTTTENDGKTDDADDSLTTSEMESTTNGSGEDPSTSFLPDKTTQIATVVEGSNEDKYATSTPANFNTTIDDLDGGEELEYVDLNSLNAFAKATSPPEYVIDDKGNIKIAEEVPKLILTPLPSISLSTLLSSPTSRDNTMTTSLPSSTSSITSEDINLPDTTVVAKTDEKITTTKVQEPVTSNGEIPSTPISYSTDVNPQRGDLPDMVPTVEAENASFPSFSSSKASETTATTAQINYSTTTTATTLQSSESTFIETKKIPTTKFAETMPLIDGVLSPSPLLISTTTEPLVPSIFTTVEEPFIEMREAKTTTSESSPMLTKEKISSSSVSGNQISLNPTVPTTIEDKNDGISTIESSTTSFVTPESITFASHEIIDTSSKDSTTVIPTTTTPEIKAIITVDGQTEPLLSTLSSTFSTSTTERPDSPTTSNTQSFPDVSDQTKNSFRATSETNEIVNIEDATTTEIHNNSESLEKASTLVILSIPTAFYEDSTNEKDVEILTTSSGTININEGELKTTRNIQIISTILTPSTPPTTVATMNEITKTTSSSTEAEKSTTTSEDFETSPASTILANEIEESSGDPIKTSVSLTTKGEGASSTHSLTTALPSTERSKISQTTERFSETTEFLDDKTSQTQRPNTAIPASMTEIPIISATTLEPIVSNDSFVTSTIPRIPVSSTSLSPPSNLTTGAIQELKLHDDPAEAANQCNEDWWKLKRKSNLRKGDEASGFDEGFDTTTRVPTKSTTTEENNRIEDDDDDERGRSAIIGREPPTTTFRSPTSLSQNQNDFQSVTRPEYARDGFAQNPINSADFGDSLILPYTENFFGSKTNSPDAQIVDPPQRAFHYHRHDTPPFQASPASGHSQNYDADNSLFAQNQGLKGDKGDPGPPGQCHPSDCAGFYSVASPPPRYERLSDEDIARIANYPGVKGAKGDGHSQESSSSIQAPTSLPAYDSQLHRYTIKGEKGEKGDRGPIGPPGQPGFQHSGGSSSSGGLVSVYPTSTELFASHRSTQVGQLAFSVSSQELFIRVNNGWQRIELEGFYPAIEQRPPVPITFEALSSKDDHLAYWLNDDGDVSGNHEPCVNRRSVDDVVVTSPADEYRPPPPAVTQHAREYEVQTLAPPSRIDDSSQVTLPQRPNDAQTLQQPQQTAHLHHPYVNPKDKVLHLIALNTPLNGKMAGIRGADLHCYQQARQAGFRTTFRAFLSSKVQDLRHLVHYADNDTIVVNARGEKLFESWGNVFTPSITPYDVPLYSFNHRNIFDDPLWTDRYIWHGSDESGRRVEHSSCEAWRSPAPYAHGMASAVLRGRPLINDGEQVSCRRHLIVLCVENMSKYNIDLRLSKRMSWKKL